MKRQETQTLGKTLKKKKIIETELLKDNSLKLIFPCFLFALMRYFLNVLLHQTCEITKFKRDDHVSEVGLPSKEREVHRVHSGKSCSTGRMRTQILFRGG